MIPDTQQPDIFGAGSGFGPSAGAATGPSFLQRLLPTLGGIAGGIGGTLLGGPLGGIAGAGLLGGIGKGVENATEGKNPLELNDVTSGLENAAGQGVGLGVGSLLGRLGGAAAQGAENIGGKLTQSAFKGGESAMSMHPNVAASQLFNLGVHDPNQAVEIASKLTGQDGLYNWGVQNGLRGATTAGRPGVDISGLAQGAQDTINQSPLISENAGNKIMNVVNKTNDVMLGGETPAGTGFGATSPSGLTMQDGQLVSKLADPQVVFDQAQSLERQGYKFLNSSNPESQAVGRAYLDIAGNLKDPLFAPGGTPLAVDDATRQGMLGKLEASGLKDSAPAVYNKALNDITNAQFVGDLRNPQSLWVNVKNGIQAAQSNKLMAAGTSAGDIAKGTLTAATNPKAALAGLTLNSSLANKMGAAGASKFADTLQSLSQTRDAAMMGKYSPASVLGGIGGTFMSNAPNYASNPQSALSLTQGASPQGTTMNPTSTGLSGHPLSTIGLSQQLDAMLAADPYLASSLVPALSGLVPQAQGLAAAGPELQAYQNTLGQAGAGQGPFGGLLSLLGGLVTGGPAAQVEPQQAALRALLTQAGIPGLSQPGLLANPAGLQAGFAPTQNVLASLGVAQ